MSKAFKGEVTLDNGMIMVMDFNAMAEFELLTGKNAFAVIESFDKGSTSIIDLRAFYYACLKRNQPEITIEEAGDVLGEYQDALVNVILAASPEAPKETKSTGSASSKKK